MAYLATLLFTISGFSQTGNISGKIVDSSSKKGLALATVTVFKAKDTSIITYRLSNQDGVFKIPGLPYNVPLRFMVTFSGYEAYRKDFTLTSEHSNLHFDSVLLGTTTKELDEVTVVAERPPVVIKKDTIEFNASAFKTLPNALVEDLLKKLPGVMVDADGNITVNGKAVNRILVDGKTFFGDDPKMATRNLPANIIDKVQVTDDKEQLLRNGDDNINNVGKVVNITLKKGVKKGWFGKVYAGGGTQDRYEAGGIANIFRDTLQVSVLGYANNLNKPGFGYTDLMQTGGLQRSGSNLSGNSTSMWSSSSGGSGITINGVSFGGMQGSGGIATSKGLGFNINHAPNAKQSIFAQYFYGNVLVDKISESDIKQYNGDTVIDNNTKLTGNVVTNAHNMGIGAKLKPDSVTTLLINASYTIGLQNEDRNSIVMANNNKLGALSAGSIMQNNGTNTYYFREGISYTRLSKTKKGRRFTITQNLDINNKFNNFTTNALTHYYYPSAYDSLLRQLRQEGVPQTTVSAALNYSEPLSKAFTLRIGSRYEYTKLNDGVNTFNPNTINKEYDVLNPQLSSNFNRESNRFYATAGMEFKWKDLTITPGARALLQYVNNSLASMPPPIKQQQNNLLPSFTVVYKRLNFNYNEDIALPSYVYLMPVADNSNPYFISKGNSNLQPAKRQNISLSYYFNDPKKNLNLSFYSNGSFTDNDVVQSITVDDKGVQTNMPVNADGSSNFYINYNINKQYKNKQNFILGINLGAYYGLNRNKLLYNGETSWQSTLNLNQWVSANLNFNDKFEWNNSYSIGYNYTKYDNPAFNKLDVLNHYWTTEVIVRMPKHVIWENSFNYTYNNGLPAGIPKDVLRWNAAINFTMLKDEKGVLRLGVYDILNRNTNISMYATRNMITTSQGNALSRYFLATFTYNIRATGAAKKKVGGDRLFLF